MSTSVPVPDEVAAIYAAHRSDGARVCYAESLGPITLVHQFSRRVEAVTLRCTKRIDADGKHVDGGPNHVDGNCCWQTHPFPPQQAGEPNPDWHRWDRCVECKQDWPCDVARLAATL